jgi:hypothetical protein
VIVTKKTMAENQDDLYDFDDPESVLPAASEDDIEVGRGDEGSPQDDDLGNVRAILFLNLTY